MNLNLQKLLLDSVCDSIRKVIPRTLHQSVPDKITSLIMQNEIAVSIQFTNSDYQMILDGQRDVFSRIGESIFGMYMEGEMLDSCVGEIANIIAGGTISLLVDRGLSIDITPPKMLSENFTFQDYENTMTVPLNIEEVGDIRVVLLEGIKVVTQVAIPVLN
jgi:chemotaxis protein CheX